jgi:hypothetical protein
VDERPILKSLATHGHSGGIDGAKIDYNSLLNRPTIYSNNWKASTAYVVGDICYSPAVSSYKRFECTVAGTSGSTEPIWPAVGSTIVDGTVTGDILGITAAQFDNSKKLANTEFVKKAGLQLAATAQYTSGPITLSATQAGQLIDLASGYTGAITLPAAASIPDGAIYYFWSGANAAVTVQRSGSDTIYINSSTVTSINLNSGDSLILMKTGAVGVGAWIAIGGSAQMIASGNIMSGGTGWTKFADGTLIQKGTTSLTDANGYCFATFPLAFFNTGYRYSSYACWVCRCRHMCGWVICYGKQLRNYIAEHD